MNRIITSILSVLWVTNYLHAESLQLNYHKALSYIAYADSVGLEQYLTKVTLSRDEITQLLHIADHERIHYQVKLSLWGDNKIYWRKIGSGLLYMTAALYCACNKFITLLSAFKTIQRDKNKEQGEKDAVLPQHIDALLTTEQKICSLVGFFIHPSLALYNDIHREFPEHTIQTNVWLPFMLTLPFTYAAYCFTCNGMQNIHKGLCYKRTLEQKISNLQTIITLLETHQNHIAI